MGGLNLYVYVDNNPMNSIDPLGLEGGDAEANPGGVNGVPFISITATPSGNLSIQNNDDPYTVIGGAFGPLAAALAEADPFLAASVADQVKSNLQQKDCPNTGPTIAGLRQIGNAKSRLFDIHAFKEDEVGKANISKYNVSVDTDDKSVWLTPLDRALPIILNQLIKR